MVWVVSLPAATNSLMRKPVSGVTPEAYDERRPRSREARSREGYINKDVIASTSEPFLRVRLSQISGAAG
jgi:hypothetical protein